MAIRSRVVALIFRLIALGLITWGVGRIFGIFEGNPSPSSFLFYTGLSNLLCFLWMIVMVVVTVRQLATSGPHGYASPMPRLSAAVMMAITVTMLIYLVVLVPSLSSGPNSDYDPFNLTSNLVHVVTPSLIILDWFLFAPKGRLRWFDPLLWTLPPYAYLVFGFTFSALGGDYGLNTRYPYPFMNVEELGIGGVALWILALSVSLIAIGYIYFLIDVALGRVQTAMTARQKAAQSPQLVG